MKEIRVVDVGKYSVLVVVSATNIEFKINDYMEDVSRKAAEKKGMRTVHLKVV